MITIKNIRKDGKPYVYCGRGTPLGNPYVIGKDGDRDEVCDLYEEWFNRMLKDTIEIDPFKQQLNDIVMMAMQSDIALGCYCAPKRCHCETIKNYLEQQLGEM